MNRSDTTIIIDARHANKVIDGLGRYIIELINGLSNLAIPRIIILHTPDFPIQSIVRPEVFIFHKVNIRGGDPRQHILLPFIIRKLKADVYFYPFIDPPFFSPAKRNVYAVHDLNHFFFSPYAATESKVAILMAKFFIHTSSLRYNNVIVFSEFVKHQLNEHVPLSKGKTVTIYHGYSPIDNSLDSKVVMDKNLTGKKFILYIGNNRPHKNLKRLFQAYEFLSKKKPEIALVVAGHQIPRFFDIHKEIAEKNMQDMVIVVSKPPNAYLALLYQKALLVVYPSLSEGFGFPLLEAWGFKIPIVTSNSTCIPEIADDAAAYFNPMRFEDIAETLERVIESKDLREELIRKGIKRLQNYSWQKSATEHLQLFINTAN